jgi:hypothetical protein
VQGRAEDFMRADMCQAKDGISCFAALPIALPSALARQSRHAMCFLAVLSAHVLSGC